MDSFKSLARRCFQKTAEREAAERRARNQSESGSLREDLKGFGAVGGCLGTVVFLVLLAAAPQVVVIGAGAVAVGWLFKRFGESSRIRRRVRQGVAAYERGDADAVAVVHRYAVAWLRGRVEAHRNRTLGANSEWGRAREPLAEALDEAGGRLAYWEERLRQEPENEMAPLQLKTARQLQDKLRSALDEVDARARVLREFYHRCEAKLAVMDRSTTDLVEVKRLEALSGRADAAVAHAQGAIEALAGQFLAEARTIADALGSADRTQLRVLAGEAPLDNIERLADRIHESSERDRSAVEALEKTL